MAQQLRNYYTYFIQQLLTCYEVDESEAIANNVFEELYMMKKHHIYILEKEIDEEEVSQLNSILERLLKHEPVQYILGVVDFFGLRFKVDKNVLIPRRETEELVDLVIKEARNWGLNESEEINVLDIGTGSGCIAISLKKNLPNVYVTALDISREALNVVKGNAHFNKVNIEIIEGDILTSTFNIQPSKFDVIVSNPPYVTIEEKVDMLKNVLEYEPHLALFVTNNDPLQFYRAIAFFAKNHLKSKGQLFFEINEQFGNDIKEMLTQSGFSNIDIIKDMQGKERIIKCYSVN